MTQRLSEVAEHLRASICQQRRRVVNLPLRLLACCQGVLPVDHGDTRPIGAFEKLFAMITVFVEYGTRDDRLTRILESTES